jgi:transcriptional regulator with GAF, ATPase, and Fis domain
MKMTSKVESTGQPHPENAKPPANGPAFESPFSAMAQELLEVYIRHVCLTDHVCLRKALLRLERDIILHILARTNGNQHEAAAILGLKPNTLHYKMQRLGITPVHQFEAADGQDPG